MALDLDATDDPLHGQQEERFFHGYYDCYCYLPLYVFCGRHLLAAKLVRPTSMRVPAASRRLHGSSPRSASTGPRCASCCVPIRISREALMAWCETNSAQFPLWPGQEQSAHGRDRGRTRRGAEQSQRTGKSERRSVTSSGRHARAGAANGGSSPRRNGPAAKPIRTLCVTSLGREEHEARHLYEKLYCARGEMENRIKECQLDLYADRTSAHTMRANHGAAGAVVCLDGLCPDQRLAPHRP